LAAAPITDAGEFKTGLVLLKAGSAAFTAHVLTPAQRP
jgi:hypothetical protein